MNSLALLDLYLQPLLIFVLVLTRISGLFLVAPVFGSVSIPRQVRALTAVALALVITPGFAWTTLPPIRNVLQLFVLIGREAALGMALAAAAMILFSAMQLAGQLISHLGGMQLGDVFDPSAGGSVPLVSQLLNLLALAVFLLIGGHRQMVRALLDMFSTIPPGRATLPPDLVEGLTRVLAISFETALRAIAPVMVALLLSMIVLGLISRTLPQLNILAIGFSVNGIVMLAGLLLTVGSAVWVFQDEASRVLTSVTQWLSTATP